MNNTNQTTHKHTYIKQLMDCKFLSQLTKSVLSRFFLKLISLQKLNTTLIPIRSSLAFAQTAMSSNKIPGGSGGLPVPQKAMPGMAKADGNPPTAKKSAPPVAPGHASGQACPVTPPKASTPQYAGSEPGQPCPASWGDYQAEWQPDPADFQHGWSAWSSWEWNQWTGWSQVQWPTADPWNGACDQYQQDPGQPMSQVASGQSSLFEVSQPPSTDAGTARSVQGQAGSFGG